MAIDFGSIKRSLQSVAGQVRSLRADIEKLKRTREDVASAPAAKEDVKAMIRAWVETTSEAYQTKLRVMLEGFIRKPAWTNEQDKVRGHLTVAGAVHQIGGVAPGAAAVDGALCTFFGPALLDSFQKVIDQMDWPAQGLPMAERVRRLDALDKEIETLSKQEAELVAASREAGISLD